MREIDREGERERWRWREGEIEREREREREMEGSRAVVFSLLLSRGTCGLIY